MRDKTIDELLMYKRDYTHFKVFIEQKLAHFLSNVFQKTEH